MYFVCDTKRSVAVLLVFLLRNRETHQYRVIIDHRHYERFMLQGFIRESAMGRSASIRIFQSSQWVPSSSSIQYNDISHPVKNLNMYRGGVVARISLTC